MPNINKDALDEQLDQYTAFLTSFGANRNSPLEILSEEMGLPTQHVTNALLQGPYPSLSLMISKLTYSTQLTHKASRPATWRHSQNCEQR